MKPSKNSQSLPERVITLIEEARRKVASAANVALVYTYYEIGRMIVEDEQGGKARADYGKTLLKDLSAKLTDRFGQGWSVENLTLMRKFYLVYRTSEISYTPFTKSDAKEIVNTVYEIQSSASTAGEEVRSAPKFTLSWSHYLVLMRIADPAAASCFGYHWTGSKFLRQTQSYTRECNQLSSDCI